MTNLTVTYKALAIRYIFVVSLFNLIDKLFGTIYVGFMSERGLSAVEVGFVLSIASIALSILDYPSGNLADKFGRVRILAMGFLCWGISFIFFALSHTFIAFSISVSIWALAFALISGAPQAWIVDQLGTAKMNEKRNSIMPLANSIALYIGAAAAGLGAFILSVGMEYVMFVSSALAIVGAVLIFFFLKENYGDADKPLGTAIWHNTKELLNRPHLRYLMMFAVVGWIPFRIFVMVWQLFALNILNISVIWFGPILTLLILAMAIGSSLALWMGRLIDLKWVSIIGYLLIGFGGLVIGLFMNLPGFLIGAGLIELGLGLNAGASASWIHNFIESNNRASILSAFSTVTSISGAAVPILAGLTIEKLSFSYVWIATFVFSVVAILLIIKMIKLEREREYNEAIQTV